MAKRKTKRPVKKKGLHGLDSFSFVVCLTATIFGTFLWATQPEEKATPKPRKVVIEQPAPVSAPVVLTRPEPVTARSLSEEAAEEQNLPPSLVHGVLLTENNGRLTANRSKAGAIGAAQLMPATAKGLGVNPYNARDNVRGGAKYLKQLTERYGNDTLAIIAYNWGPGNADRWLKRGGKWHELPKETRDYVSRVKVNAALSETKMQLAWEGK